MIFGFSFSYITWRTSQDPPLMSSHTQPSILTGGSLGPPWMSPHTQPTRQSGGSQGYPRILPTHSPPGSLEDPKGIPGSSLDVPPHPLLQAVWRIPRVSQDLFWMSPHTQPSRQSGGSQGHPKIPTHTQPSMVPKDISGTSLGASTLTNLQAIQRIPRTSQDSSLLTPCT